MKILLDLQALQTPDAVRRGVGKFTNGLLGALASSHKVIGLRRSSPYLVSPKVDIPTIEIPLNLKQPEIERLILPHQCDVVVNCSGPYWNENVIVSDLKNAQRPIIASIFYDAIPWVFPQVYLENPQVRRNYHNRCVDLYAHADLVCAISQHSAYDALRFGYATDETLAAIYAGIEPLIPEITNARDKWKIPRPYLLSVSGDEFRKNPEMLISAFLQCDLRKSRFLVIVISNDTNTGFSQRMNAKYGNLKARGIIILPEVTESELGALYRDCDAFVFTSLYEGFGLPIVEAMQSGKWIISSQFSSLAEVCGPALLAPIKDPKDIGSIANALNQAGKRLNEGPLDESVPKGHAKKFTWAQVIQNFEDAVIRRREAMALKMSGEAHLKPRLFWASPFPSDISGIAFYSEDLIGSVGQHYDIVLVPNTVSTFVPTPKTGQFKIVEAQAKAVLAMSGDEPPFIFYHIGNSHFHLELLDLLFKIPGIVLLHDSFIKGLEGIWLDRISGFVPNQVFSQIKPGNVFHRWCRILNKIDRLPQSVQSTHFRQILGRIARLPGIRLMVLAAAQFCRAIAIRDSLSKSQIVKKPEFSALPLDAQIIESSRAMIFLCEHAKSLIEPKYLARRPTHVIPLYSRYRGAISMAKRTELRRKYAIPEDAFVVTTAGFQSTIKLTDTFARACLDLRRLEGASVYVQVIGKFWDADFKREVSSLLEGSDVNAFISDDFVDEAVLTERLALSDVAVFLRSASTGGPSAGLNDALGMGIPCLATNDFAFRDYPRTAVLCVANTEVTLGLIRLYRHKAVRQLLAAGALQYSQSISEKQIAMKIPKVLSLYEPDRSAEGEKLRVRVGKTSPMVFIDITYDLMHNWWAGTQRVVREIIVALRKLDPNAQYFELVAWEKSSRQFRVVSLNHLINRGALPPAETWLPECPVADIHKEDHLFVLATNWPLGDPYFADLLLLHRRGIKLSAFIYDLFLIRHRWSFFAHHPRGTEIDLFRVFCEKVIPICTNILTYSNYVTSDLRKFLEETGCVTLPTIHILKLGSDWAVPFADVASNTLSKSKNRLVKNPYILYVATLELRKNHERLFKAFVLARKLVNNLDLVLAGRIDGSAPDTILEFIRKSKWIHHFEKSDDATLKQLYNECLFTVFPSLDEGYGLPVVESFKHGKFCLASQAGAIPETGGMYADYFDPYDVQLLAEKILLYVTNPKELQRREKLLDTYRPTSWGETAWQIAQIFYGDIRGKRTDSRNLDTGLSRT